MLAPILSALALTATSAQALVANSNDAGNPNNFHRHLLKRAITTDVTQVTSQNWDFIIAGGGVAGLAVAARLAEWSNTTVLVIEAGTDGSEVQEAIDIPGYSYLKGLTGAGKATDWSYNIQGALGSSKWPRGKVLGGSGAVNGMFWGRGSQEDYDAWATLNPGGNQTWNFDEVNKYIMKAERFQAPDAATISEFSIPIDNSAHGTSGPIWAGMSNFIYPAVANWVPGWESLGFAAKDLAAGSTHGVTITPSTLNPNNGSRCDSKCGYVDAQPPRPNLTILTGQQVTKVNFNSTSGNLVASGVSFSAASGSTVYTVNANKEVILSGGTVGSPQILQLSGIGPKSVLESAGVTVLKDLPVGYNLQDHVSASMYFTTVSGTQTWTDFANNADAQADALTQWRNNGTGIWTYINEAVGYPSMTDIMGSASAASSAASGLDISAIVSQITNAHGYPSSSQQGLTKQFNIQQKHLNDETGQLEIILTMYAGTANPVGIQVAVQHPFSRGTLFIATNDPFTQPIITPDYLSVDIDNTIALNGFKFARTLAKTAPMAKFMAAEAGTAGLDDTALLAAYRSGAGTEFHPSSSCSMLPEADGGVVDTNLIVYGTQNLRVIDASIIPLSISAHLMATSYGIAEKGADIVKEAHVYVAPPVTSSSSSSSSSAPSSTSSAETSSTTSESASGAADAANNSANSSALSSNAKLGIGIGVGVGAAALLAAIIAFCCMKRNKNAKRAGDEKGWYSGAAGGGAGADGGAWDANAAYNEQGYPMGRPQRPFSTAGESINTIATHDLQTNAPGGYNMGDYSTGGNAPYQDYPEPAYGNGGRH